MSISVFIVDDHYMVIEGIRSLLQYEKSIELIGHAMSGSSCLAFLKNRLPNVILMDINLPDVSGIDLCKEVKEKYPSVFIIGLSTFNQKSFVQRMMDNGASGYVLKNASADELLESVQAVVKGKTYMSFEAARSLKSGSDNKFVVTRREKQVLELIAEGMTNIDVAKKLGISATTVDTHRRNLLFKFSAKNTAELVKLAMLNKIIGD